MAYTLAHEFVSGISTHLSIPTASDVLACAGQINHILTGRTDLTLATAESCTGGSVAQAITAFAGSSDYFLGGIVSYSNAAKHNILGVSIEILETKGAVSAECAEAMAHGARAALQSSIAVATTGIAGPGGATPRKPIGLVYLAVATETGTTVQEHHFAGDRHVVTLAATHTALQLLVDAIQQYGSPTT
ncbi:MAG TPA: CinA family protein [Thermomicrobiales bacterium]|nr:CinA family protein [Thermomicrobiales bacterium]